MRSVAGTRSTDPSTSPSRSRRRELPDPEILGPFRRVTALAVAERHSYDPKVGVLVQVAIVPGGQFAQLQNQKSGDALEITAVQGLIDTGADSTCIAPSLINQLGLKPIGKIQTVGVTGEPTPMNQYTVDLALRFGAQVLGIGNLAVSEFSNESPIFQVLIGRDIICRGVLTMDFSGRFSFSV